MSEARAGEAADEGAEVTAEGPDERDAGTVEQDEEEDEEETYTGVGSGGAGGEGACAKPAGATV